MNINPLSALASVLFLSSLALSCKPTEFGSVIKNDAPAIVGFGVTCEQEKAKMVEAQTTNTNAFKFAKNCVSESKSDKKPADIVFVIDITASMEDSINTVKNGVERFANQLRQDKGWDARFAAIGFRDEVSDIVPFSDEKTLAASVKRWLADGGDDPQEAGQAALAAAVQLIKQDASSNQTRASANKIILFIGDAIGYALNGNHKDFSTSELEQIFATLPANIKSQTKFYHSTAKEIEGCVLPTIFGCARKAKSTELAANGQMSALAQKIGLAGRSFDFPFTESIMLNEFIDEFVPGQACSLVSVVARDGQGKELARGQDNGSITLPQGVSKQGLKLEVERCCAGPASPGAGTSAKQSCNNTKTILDFKSK